MTVEKLVYMLIGFMLADTAYYGYKAVSPVVMGWLKKQREEPPDDRTTDANDLFI